MKTILLIEDNHDIRENTTELLELEGYCVITAPDGRAGINLAKEQNPHIILCDIMMPEANGYEVFNEVRNHKDTSHIPFIFFTASVEKKEVEKALGMGVNGYVRKPFAQEELFEAIKICIDKR